MYPVSTTLPAAKRRIFLDVGQNKTTYIGKKASTQCVPHCRGLLLVS